ncbi:hypothetical protein JTS92_09670 [Clostridium botulinum]|nr:hypothetical protein [Clostridium botulinum]
MKDEIESMVNTIKQEAQHNKLVIFIGAGFPIILDINLGMIL